MLSESKYRVEIRRTEIHIVEVKAFSKEDARNQAAREMNDNTFSDYEELQFCVFQQSDGVTA